MNKNEAIEHIFIIGGTTFDHIVSLSDFPEPKPQTIHQAPFLEATGSTGSGKALSMQKLMLNNTLYSILGDDFYGRKIIDHLEKENVDFIYDYDPIGTERHFNIMDAEGGRISMFITQSSEYPKISFSKIEGQIKKADIIVLNIISYCKTIIPILEKYNKPVWTDLHDYNDGNIYHEPFINASDYLFLSSDNLTDYRKTMKTLINRGKELVVCTHGKEGSTALTSKGEWMDEPALSGISIVDSNGAGDNFFSGFLYAYLQGKPINECLKYGSISGASCISSQQLVAAHLNPNYLEEQYTKLY